MFVGPKYYNIIRKYVRILQSEMKMRIKIDKCTVCVHVYVRVHVCVCVHTSVCAIQVYDVSSFVDHHPGGLDQILYRAGRDITQLFESYHPFSAYKQVVTHVR